MSFPIPVPSSGPPRPSAANSAIAARNEVLRRDCGAMSSAMPTPPVVVASIGEYTLPAGAYRDFPRARHAGARREGDTAMSEHPWIDFDGDGHGDSYDTAQDDHGHYAFIHHDAHGHVDRIAYDNNGDGKIDEMLADENHDGTMDTLLSDTNHDGYMDHTQSYGYGHESLEHPKIDFNGDGHYDSYESYNDGYGNTNFIHTDGHGHVDAIAQDDDHNRLIDREYVDENHDGRLDHLLSDGNGDGIMDYSTSV